MISKELRRQNFTVTRRTVYNVLKTQKSGEENLLNGSLAKKKRLSDIRTPFVVMKVRDFIAPDNPPTQLKEKA
jgi:hypothetical protein